MDLNADTTLFLFSKADATLINGLGRYPNGPASPLSVITVQKGKRSACEHTEARSRAIIDRVTVIDSD